jgi:DNA-binding NarL/FixJ family response regulator
VEWEVCGEAATGREAKAEEHHPHVVVLDLGMPEMNGITAARILKRQMPDVI